MRPSRFVRVIVWMLTAVIVLVSAGLICNRGTASSSVGNETTGDDHAGSRMTRRVRQRRRLSVSGPAIAVTVILVIAGSASAFLATHGSGTGSGSARATAQPLSVAAATGTQSLVPTGTPSGDLAATITNPNGSSAHIASLSLDTSQGTNGFSANASSCALSVATQTNGGNGWTVPANGHISIDLTNAVTMSTAAANSCQGQSFTVYLKTP